MYLLDATLLLNCYLLHPLVLPLRLIRRDPDHPWRQFHHFGHQ
jgi:hypothetical protein